MCLLMYLLFWCSSFFHIHPYFHLISLSFCLKDIFYYFYISGLLMNSLCYFFLSCYCWIQYSRLTYFSFCNLKMLLLYLAYIICIEKSLLFLFLVHYINILSSPWLLLRFFLYCWLWASYYLLCLSFIKLLRSMGLKCYAIWKIGGHYFSCLSIFFLLQWL